MRIFLFILFFLIAIFGVYFALLNAESVRVNYFFGSLEMPLSMVMLVFLSVGAIVGLMVRLGAILGYKMQVRKLKREIKTLSPEVQGSDH